MNENAVITKLNDSITIMSSDINRVVMDIVTKTKSWSKLSKEDQINFLSKKEIILQGFEKYRYEKKNELVKVCNLLIYALT